MQPTSHSMLFQWLRWRMLGNTARQLIGQSLLRVVTILLCSLLIWGCLFLLSYAGFHALRVKRIPLDGQLIGLLFDFMFVALTMLLVFSSGIILYSSLFASAETAFLLSKPVGEDQVFAYKYQGAVAFSSWAFILLGSPILIAYGLFVPSGAPWHFYLLLPLFFLGFVLLPGSLGALACLLLVNFLPRQRKQVLIVVGILVIVLGVWWTYGRVRAASTEVFGSQAWMNQVLGELAVVRAPMLPARWIANGLQAAAVGDLSEAGFYLALLWSNSLLLYVVTAWLAKKLYRRGYNRLQTGGTRKRRYGGAWIDAVFAKTVAFLDPQTQLLILKDFRTFRRDPAQWAQVLIFVGLAILYFTNMRRFFEHNIGRPFQNGISLLNLCAVSFLMCAYTGRFIYPMLSLEGKKFWILGLLPMNRDRLLWGKFAFSAVGCLVVAEFLVIFSNVMLGMPWIIVVVHALTAAVLALGFSGLSVGLGAMMPNFRETDPSKIAVGFGGTLNLVAGLLLLMVVIATAALPWHLAVAVRIEQNTTLSLDDAWLTIFTVIGLAIGAVAVVVPLRAGAWALRRMEF